HRQIGQSAIARITVTKRDDVPRADAENAFQGEARLALRFHPLAIPRPALPIEPAGGGAVAEADVPVGEQFPTPVAGLLVVTRCPSRHHCPSATRPAAAAALCASR